MSLSEVLSGWMAVAIGPGSRAESFIWAATLCARRAGRSAEDRLLCKQEVLGSNPSRSTPVPYLPRFKSTFRTVPDLGLGSSAWPCAVHRTGSYQGRSGSVGTRADDIMQTEGGVVRRETEEWGRAALWAGRPML